MIYILKNSTGEIVAQAPTLRAINDAKILYGLTDGTIEETNEELVRGDMDHPYFYTKTDWQKIVDSKEYQAKEAENKKRARIDEIKKELEEIDREGQRASRAIALVMAGVTLQEPATLSMDGNALGGELVADTPQDNLLTFNPDDLKKLQELEKRAEGLREELKSIDTPITLQPQD